MNQETENANSKTIISIDWCDDSIKEALPWDASQFVEVKMLSNAQKLKRDGIMAKFSNQGESQGIQMQYAEVKLFEYENSITDFCFKDSRGKVLRYDPSQLPRNRAIFEHCSGELAAFIDGLIDRVNGNGEADEMLGNSAGSSGDMQIPVSLDQDQEAGA
jgi:hypothetical protein